MAKGILADLLIKIGLDSKGLDKGIGDAKKKTDAFGNGLKRVGSIIAGAFAVDRIIAFGKELVNLSGVAKGVREAFTRMGGDKFMQDLRNSTAGTVSELGLMKRAVQANNFQIPIKDLAKLFEFATKRAQQTGQSVDYLVDSIVLGIGRKSPLILDNLGISAVMLQQKLKGVGVEMTTVADIAAAVGEIAAEEMEKSGGIIETNAIKIERLKAGWSNFKLGLSENTKFNDDIGNWLDGLNRQIKMLPENLAYVKKLFPHFGSDLITPEMKQKQLEEIYGVGNVKKKTKHIDEETTAFRNNINAEQEYIETKIRNGRTIAELEEATANLEAQVKTYGEFQQAEIQKTLQQIDANKKLIESLTTLKTKREDLGYFDSMIKPVTDLPTIKNAPIGVVGLETGKLDLYSKEQLSKADEMYKEYTARFEQFKNDFASLVQDFGVEVVEQFGQAIGTMIASGKFPDDFGSQVLSIIGSFLVTLGEMLITMGVAASGFQELLKSAFTNPLSAGLAIAAGAALVLLGSAFQGAAKAGPSGGSSGGGSISGSSYSMSNYSGSDTRAENNTVEFVIKGNTLVGVLNNQSRKNGLIG